MTDQPRRPSLWYTSHGMKEIDGPRERPIDDFYPSPDQLCRVTLRDCLDIRPERLLDPGCGNGPWGRAARELWPDSEIVGVEVTAGRIDTARADGLLTAYNTIIHADFLETSFDVGFDAIIGNPPYSLAEEFVMRSLALLRPGGVICFLLRTAFLESQRRYERMFSGSARPSAVYMLVERPSFTGDGKTDATAYSVFVWRSGFPGDEGQNQPTSLHWLRWRDVDKPQQMGLFE